MMNEESKIEIVVNVEENYSDNIRGKVELDIFKADINPKKTYQGEKDMFYIYGKNKFFGSVQIDFQIDTYDKEENIINNYDGLRKYVDIGREFVLESGLKLDNVHKIVVNISPKDYSSSLDYRKQRNNGIFLTKCKIVNASSDAEKAINDSTRHPRLVGDISHLSNLYNIETSIDNQTNSKVDHLDLGCVFYKNDEVVFAESRTVNNIEPGINDDVYFLLKAGLFRNYSLRVNFEEDIMEFGEPIDFDTCKVFLTHAYDDISYKDVKIIGSNEFLKIGYNNNSLLAKNVEILDVSYLQKTMSIHGKNTSDKTIFIDFYIDEPWLDKDSQSVDRVKVYPNSEFVFSKDVKETYDSIRIKYLTSELDDSYLPRKTIFLNDLVISHQMIDNKKIELLAESESIDKVDSIDCALILYKKGDIVSTFNIRFTDLKKYSYVFMLSLYNLHYCKNDNIDETETNEKISFDNYKIFPFYALSKKE